MNFTKNQLIIAAVTGLVVIALFLVILGVIPGLRTSRPEAIAANLTIWNVGDGEEAFASAFAAFKEKYKNVTFAYRSFPDETTYEAALLDALAAGTGPDIFAVRNDKLFRHFNKIAPASAVTIGLPELRARFPQVVEKNFYGTSGTFALPLSIDTLALFVNRDLLDAAGFATIPATWEEVQTLAPKLTKTEAGGAVTQYGIALGGGSSEVETAVDALYLLMLQNGTEMVDESLSQARFSSPQGLNALQFYLQFGNPASAAYAWNAGAGTARERFADGKLAMLVDYSSAISFLTARNALLNYGVAPVPQPKSSSVPLTYASYYGLAVSRRAANPALAWEFIKTMTTSESVARAYAAATRKPPALRSLVAQYENEPVGRVFARQILTARSWPQVDPDAIRASFARMLDTALIDPNRAPDALRAAAAEVTALLERRAF
jgi:multiple sugar transport system substrate-binding protein